MADDKTFRELVFDQATVHETEVHLRREITTLRAQLAKFGGHTTKCRKGVVIGPDFKTAECDCGFDELGE